MESASWSLGDIAWSRLDRSKVNPHVLSALKTAALVEFNSPDYVSYLKNVLRDNPSIQQELERWGAEERQHGLALKQWVERVDADFNFDQAVLEFRSLYQVDTQASVSKRGSPAGEMLSRCVVESATSFFYTAIKDTTEEPCLRQICQFIARDEFAHYQLFLRIMNELGGRPGWLKLLWIALQRVNELGDEELASAFYAAHFHHAEDKPVFDAELFASVYESRAVLVYQQEHAYRMSSMIARALGVSPWGRLMKGVQPIIWRYWTWHLKRVTRKAECRGYGLDWCGQPTSSFHP